MIVDIERFEDGSIRIRKVGIEAGTIDSVIIVHNPYNCHFAELLDALGMLREEAIKENVAIVTAEQEPEDESPVCCIQM